ncbi:MAG TPA: ribulose-phosphate 3-epimerase [Thermoleophilaceae bacterium]|nr:ribulose-phosphate 3-epimerase [Thermoleophilaceae bacterium]
MTDARGAYAMLRERRVAPSILATDFAHLGDRVREVMDAGARVIHVDVMDGHFVPPITIGPLIVSGLKEQVHDAGGMLDVHLMIERPERQVAEFASAGADQITVHLEATPHVHYAVKAVREAGCLAGVAITPSTPADALAAIAPDLDTALCMTVNPGWGGQPFIPETLPKVERLRELLPDEVAIEVDGGVDVDTAPRCAAAGARLFVAGSAVMGADDPAEAYRRVAAAAGAA